MDGNVSQITSVVAGLVAGSASVVVGHPFDTIKTRMQVGSQPFGNGSNLSNKTISRGILREIRSLYRGVVPPLIAVGTVQSINFPVFEAIRCKLLQLTKERRTKGFDNEYKRSTIFWYLGSTAIAGSGSGFLISILTLPISVIKIQQQLASEKNVYACARNVVKLHGFRALYRAGGPGLFMEIIGRSVYFTTYEAMKLFQLRQDNNLQRIVQGDGSPVQTSMRVKVLAASVAGICGWCSVYALDVTKSRMILDIDRSVFPTWWSCVRATYREGGLRRFYRGLSHAMVRAAPVAAMVLPVYEIVRMKLTIILNGH